MTETIRFIDSAEDLAAAHHVRHLVFVEEQGVSVADEIDGRDPEALHLLVERDGRAIGAARVLVHDGVAKIGRVCVLPEARGDGLGGRMLAVMLDHLRDSGGVRKAKLGAQIAAMSLYARAGFAPVGERYMDAGLEHQDMERAL